MKNLVLVGFVGSGKTSAGKIAAQRLGLKFLDMDDLMEQRHNQTISTIFETKGEAFFREHERNLVRELAARQDHCIATGAFRARFDLADCCLPDDRIVVGVVA